jgi:hypothetical protein
MSSPAVSPRTSGGRSLPAAFAISRTTASTDARSPELKLYAVPGLISAEARIRYAATTSATWT